MAEDFSKESGPTEGKPNESQPIGIESKEPGDIKVQISGLPHSESPSKASLSEKDSNVNFDVKEQFGGLPLGLLICTPIIEVAKGQAELCKVYLDNIMRLAFKDGDKKNGTNTIEFDLERPVINGDTGEYSTEKIKVSAPVLCLVPVPAFTMEEATVRFTMEVKEATIDKNENTAQATVDLQYKSVWGLTAKITGQVTTKSEHTRTTDQSAKYDIFARAIQHPPAEGMAKLTNLFSSIIEPIVIKSQ